MNIKSLITLSLTVFILMSCNNNKNEDEFSETLSGVQSAQASFSTVSSGSKVSIKVGFTAYNGCGKFNRFEEVWDESKTTVDVKVYVRYPKDETACTQSVKPLEGIYEFTPSAAGIYTVRFFAGSTSLVQQITVL